VWLQSVHRKLLSLNEPALGGRLQVKRDRKSVRMPVIRLALGIFLGCVGASIVHADITVFMQVWDLLSQQSGG